MGNLLFRICHNSLMHRFQIFERVNQRLPEREQIEFFGRWPGKVWRVRKLYREYYPDSRLAQWEKGLDGTMGSGRALASPLIHSVN